MKKYIISRIAWLLCLLLAMTGCSKEMASSFYDDEIKPGDPVMFTINVSGKGQTRTIEPDETFTGYSAATDEYAITIEMYRQSDGIKIGEGNYKPSTTPGDGTLVVAPSGSQLYWPDNTQAYGFKATAGTTTLANDQHTKELFISQDQLLGYAFVPLKDTDNPSTPQYTANVLNYKTSKQWKTANADFGVTGFDNQKKIPIYLKHRRSRITVILKAGEGVSRDDLANTNYLEAKIYSYSGETTTEISPWATSTTIDYTAGDYGGAANGVSTTQYTAIVEPYEYQANNTKPIAQIKLSNQTFKFLVGNETAVDKSNYNLTAGKHLIITATLARGNDQKVLLTAQVVPWTEVSTDATVGDDGLVGSTTDIDSRTALLTFLSGENNKAGNIANITADIDLESGEDWTSQPLNCTMKMNNHTLTTTHRIFSTIGVGGKLIGGTISVGGDGTVDAAIAETNRGTIQSITVDRTSTAKATIAGLVVTNSGTISTCTSNLPVSGTSDVVGGIAKKSVYHSDNGSMPVIEGCIANARVEGSGDTVGGGIVGKAVGRVSGNTFEYGITILQNTTNFKNIVGGKYDDEAHHQLRAYNNTWPTNADNTIGDDTKHNENMTSEANRFNATIDSQAELAEILGGDNNNSGNKYRLSDNFEVTETGMGGNGWQNNYSGIAAAFWLDGNYKNIITYPTTLILFGEIGTHTTNLYVNGELVSTTP